MAKFRLQPDPTFASPVEIPVHGGNALPVTFTFKHRPRDQFNEWLKELPTMADGDMIMSIVAGWDVEGEDFNRPNVDKLVQNYMGAPTAILNKYLSENGQARLGNSGK